MGKSETFAKALERRAAERRRNATVLSEGERIQRQMAFWQMIAGALLARIPGQKAIIPYAEAGAIEGSRIVYELNERQGEFHLTLARKPEDAA